VIDNDDKPAAVDAGPGVAGEHPGLVGVGGDGRKQENPVHSRECRQEHRSPRGAVVLDAKIVDGADYGPSQTGSG